MVTFYIMSPRIRHDKFHLLYADELPDILPGNVLYSETGDAIQLGFQPVILNVDYYDIKDSRLMLIRDGTHDLWCLIDKITPVTRGKSSITYTLDAWLNCRDNFHFGNQNTIYNTSAIIPYDFHIDYGSSYKFTNFIPLISQLTKWNVVILYHDSPTNVDYVYYVEFGNSYFEYAVDVFKRISLYDSDFDSNSVIGVWVSPIDFRSFFFDATFAPTVTNPYDSTKTWTNPLNTTATNINLVYKCLYTTFIHNYRTVQTGLHSGMVVEYTPMYHTVIIGMDGLVHWEATPDDIGVNAITYAITLTYNGLFIDGYIVHDDIQGVPNSPQKRFTIACPEIPYFSDYYELYQNTMKTYNQQLRDLQLTVDTFNNTTNTIASSFTAGSYAMIFGAKSPLTSAGLNLIGGTIKTVGDLETGLMYNYNLNKLEEQNAKVQYDAMSLGSAEFMRVFRRIHRPMVARKELNVYSQNGFKNISYNCHIKIEDLNNLFFRDFPEFIQGDFDFIDIADEWANQLNARFKHGVSFVPWTDANRNIKRIEESKSDNKNAYVPIEIVNGGDINGVDNTRMA